MSIKTSALVKLAFPIGLIGSILKTYSLKLSGIDDSFDSIGIEAGILIGTVTGVSFVGFLIFVHFNLFPVPKDLFSGSIFGKASPLFRGNPAIFRQGIVLALCLLGAGVGFVFAGPILHINVMGIGISSLMPGLGGIIVLISLWRMNCR